MKEVKISFNPEKIQINKTFEEKCKLILVFLEIFDFEDFDFDDYARLPDVLYNPDKIEQDGKNTFKFYKEVDSRRLIAVIKVLNGSNEIYLTSQHLASERQWRKAFK